MNDKILEIKVILDNAKALKEKYEVALFETGQSKSLADAKVIEYSTKIKDLEDREKSVAQLEKDIAKREAKIEAYNNFEDGVAQFKGEKSALLKDMEAKAEELNEREEVIILAESVAKNRETDLDAKAEKLALDKATYKDGIQKEMETKFSKAIRG